MYLLIHYDLGSSVRSILLVVALILKIWSWHSRLWELFVASFVFWPRKFSHALSIYKDVITHCTHVVQLSFRDGDVGVGVKCVFRSLMEGGASEWPPWPAPAREEPGCCVTADWEQCWGRVLPLQAAVPLWVASCVCMIACMDVSTPCLMQADKSVSSTLPPVKDWAYSKVSL